MQKLVFATNNENKLSEVKEMLEGLFEVVSLKEVEIFEDIPEDADTLEGNARIKALHVHKKTGLNVFADDTGLEIDYLNGEPGVYSARYAGVDKDAEGNMKLVLSKMKGILNRKAQFRTSIALILDNKEYLFEGNVQGKILSTKYGKKGFGYDPIFKPNGFDCSFAEMSSKDKNKISHRGRAIQKLISFLKNHRE